VGNSYKFPFPPEADKSLIFELKDYIIVQGKSEWILLTDLILLLRPPVRPSFLFIQSPRSGSTFFIFAF
jgi:hypothetical protein